MQVSTAGERAEVVLLASIPKAPDLELHVRRVRIDGVDVVEVRDFICSLQQYGRGYWVPLSAVAPLIAALTEVA